VALATIIGALALVILAKLEWDTQKARSRCELRMEVTLAPKDGDNEHLDFVLRVVLIAENAALCLSGNLNYREEGGALLLSTPQFAGIPKTLTPYTPAFCDIDTTFRSILAKAPHPKTVFVQIPMEYVYQGKHKTSTLEGKGWVADDGAALFGYSYAGEPRLVVSSKTPLRGVRFPSG
jgi:hypothetical protein